MKDRIAKIIQEYSEQGIHRTGTDVDSASADWFSAQIKSFGLRPQLERFLFKRVRPLDNRLVIGGEAIEGVPIYDCTYTNDKGVTGTIGEIGSDADIGVVSSFPHFSTPGGKALYKARHENRHKAIIVITRKPLPEGIATFNAEHFKEPFGPPVLQVSNAAETRIRNAMETKQKATAIVHCDYADATAINVGATIKGRNPELAPLVIMTPRSGWWYNAAERGGGIACWLEMMRALADVGSDRDVIFTANTGHELGHIGLDHFLENNRHLIKDAHMWIHLGANFAAAGPNGIRLQFSDTQARELTFSHLEKSNLTPKVETPLINRPMGEARNVYDGKGRYISLLGNNNLFHHPLDQWPNAVNLQRTHDWVNAFAELSISLSKG